MGLLAAAALHWVAAGLMILEHMAVGSFGTSMPERGWRFASGLVASISGLS